MIFYLSGTGNTKWVAERLAASLDEEAVDVASVMHRDIEISDSEYLGFCFPIHGWRVPSLMLQFIDNLDGQAVVRNNPFVFAVCTAGDTIGEAMDRFSERISKKGISLRAAYGVRMPNTYVGMPFMDVDSKEVQTAKLKEAEHRVAKIAEQIKERCEVTDLKYEGRWRRINSRCLGALFTNYLVTDKLFSVDESLCVKCGKCAAVCPVDNIRGGVGEAPLWKHNKKCMTCFACYHYCPKHAIQYGWMTRGKGQYHFPNAPQEE